jgi:TRAP-type C4-dicarboxylate transport system permease small subunit
MRNGSQYRISTGGTSLHWRVIIPHMDKLTHDRRERLIFRFAFISTAVAMVIVLLLVLAQAFVRYSTNQTFTFLGGNELEVLTASAFLAMLGLAYMHRPERSLN